MQTGIRELKAKLSEYVGQAAAGQSVTITDRGRPVARLVGLNDESAVDRGIDEGWIEAPRRHKLEQVDRRAGGRSVSEMMDEDRG